MSTPNALAFPTRGHMLAQGAKLLTEPLADFIGVPGIQDFIRNAQGLVATLKVDGVCISS